MEAKEIIDPTPGSDEAIKLGCTCPVLDNAHGRGVLNQGGNQFWVTEGCPLHDAQENDQIPVSRSL